MTIIKALKKRFGGKGQTIAKVIETMEIEAEVTPATASKLGGVKIGNGINVDESGVISTNSLPAYTEADNDKVLKIVNGVPTWVTLG